MIRHIRLLASVSLLSLAASVEAGAQSAWMPVQGHLIVTPAFSYSSFDEFWAGENRVSPLKANGESLDQLNVFVSLEYGILDRLAFDATIGYTRVDSTFTFGSPNVDGLADTQLGLRYRILDETEWLPVLVARMGGVVAGTYDENTPFAPGDGANAFETSFLLGKSFGYTGFGSYGSIGYGARDHPVPDEYFASVGVFKQFISIFGNEDALTASAGYRHVESLEGLDIGGPGFNPGAGKAAGFPALREINQLFEGALGYTDVGGRHYQFSAATNVDGRNTGDKTIFGFSVSIPFSQNLLLGGQ